MTGTFPYTNPILSHYTGPIFAGHEHFHFAIASRLCFIFWEFSLPVVRVVGQHYKMGQRDDRLSCHRLLQQVFMV